jgi:hypothetical protein
MMADFKKTIATTTATVTGASGMTTRPQHPEAAADEVLIGNMLASDFKTLGWLTKRMGIVAYETNGRRLANFRPVFVKRPEIEAAGVEIPSSGTIDYRSRLF